MRLFLAALVLILVTKLLGILAMVIFVVSAQACIDGNYWVAAIALVGTYAIMPWRHIRNLYADLFRVFKEAL